MKKKGMVLKIIQMEKQQGDGSEPTLKVKDYSIIHTTKKELFNSLRESNREKDIKYVSEEPTTFNLNRTYICQDLKKAWIYVME